MKGKQIMRENGKQPKSLAWFALLGIVGSCALATSLASVPVNAQGMFLNPFEERRMGEQTYASFLEKNGGKIADPKLTAYLVEFCQRIANATAKHPDQFVFSVVRNPEPNAFATYGGFVYIQAGILPWMNDEAELAAVLGHEVGHSINRHLAKSYSRTNMAKAGYKFGVLTGRFRGRESEVKEGLKLQVISYGRDQELESDVVGFAVDGKMGLDTLGAARMLTQLSRMEGWYSSTYKVEEITPSYLQSHPQSSERISRAISLAEAQGGTDSPRNRDRYLDAINGMRLDLKSGPRFVRVVTVRNGETATSLAKRVAMPNPQHYFLAINGLDSPDQLKPGMRVKLVTIK